MRVQVAGLRPSPGAADAWSARYTELANPRWVLSGQTQDQGANTGGGWRVNPHGLGCPPLGRVPCITGRGPRAEVAPGPIVGRLEYTRYESREPVGAENRVTVPDQRVHGSRDLALSVSTRPA